MKYYVRMIILLLSSTGQVGPLKCMCTVCKCKCQCPSLSRYHNMRVVCECVLVCVCVCVYAFAVNNGGDKREMGPCHKFGVNVTDKLRR